MQMRIRDDDVLVARDGVRGIHATGSTVLRARLHDTDTGVRVSGRVTPAVPTWPSWPSCSWQRRVSSRSVWR